MDRTRTFDAVIRVSRVAGREGDAFMSPSEQRESIQRRADRDGVTISEWWDETDSVSGGTVEREGLQAAIKRAVSGKTDGILVAKVDRFARTVIGGLGAINTLEDAGKELWSAREGVIVGEEKATATDKIIRGFWLLLAQWQRDTLTEGWEAVRHRHIANGIYTQEPYGYRKDSYTRVLAPVSDEVPWITGMYERRADAMAWAKIAAWLNGNGVRTRDDVLWTVNSVRRLIQSRVYLGEISSGDIVNPAAHEPIVSLDLWQRANAHNRSAALKGEATEYKLTSIIRCTGCGVTMRGNGRRTKYGAYRYYDCRRHHTFGACPEPARIRADEIEAAVEDVFRTKFLHPTCEAQGDVSTEALDAAVLEQQAAEAELRDFLVSDSTIEMGRVLGKAWIEEGQAARLARVVEAREAVAEARNAVLGVTLPMNLSEIWDSLGVEEQRAFLADAFEVVAVRRGGGFRIWTRNDPSVPRDLPGRGGTSCITPISVDDAPPGAGKTAA